MNKEIVCPTCSNQLSVSDVNMEKLVGRCFKCNSLFDVTAQVTGAPAAHGVASRASRPKVDQPKSIKLKNWGSEFSLSKRWFGFHIAFLTLWCVMWDGFLVTFYVSIFSKPTINWGEAAFPSVHLIAGIAVTYYTLAGYLNTTEVKVRPGTLSVTHGPLKWPGNLSIDTADIEQLFVVQKIGNKGSRSYELCAVKRDGTKQKVLGGISSSDEAHFMEQALEEHLKIEDKAVTGEHL